MRNVLTSGILAAAVAFAAMGCEDPPKPQPQRQAKPPKPAKKKVEKPKVKKLTTAQKVALIKDCWKAADAGDDKAFVKKCYSDKITVEMVDRLPPAKMTGPQNILASIKPMRDGFPDMKREVGMIFLRGDDAAVVYSVHGTNKGELMGKEATEKPIGYVAAQVLRLGPEGKGLRELHYVDQGTVAGQLGWHEMPFRPVREAGKWAEVQVVVAKNDKKEKDNLALFQKIKKVAHTKDVEKVMEHYADDAVFAYMPDKEDAKGKDAIKKSFDQWYKMSTDSRSTTEWSWAAGDYVVAAGRTSGTNDGDMGPKMPATNKKFSMRGLEVMKFAEGKVTEHWMFGNGLKMAVDLGIAEDPSAVAKKDDEDKGDDDPAEKEKAAAKDAPKKAPPPTKAAGAKPPAPAPAKPKTTDEAYD